MKFVYDDDAIQATVKTMDYVRLDQAATLPEARSNMTRFTTTSQN